MAESNLGTKPFSKRATTLMDIAKQLDVSPRTVSQVLSGSKNSTTRVGALTAKRIQDLAGKLNYRPSGLARAMRGKGLKQVGFIVEYNLDRGRMAPHIAMPAILGASDYLTSQDWHLRIIRENSDDAPAEMVPKYLQEHVVDGVILNASMSAKDDAVLKDLGKYRVPRVVLNGSSEYNTVCLDDFSGIQQAVNHLIGIGHTRIAYVGTRVGGDHSGSKHHSLAVRQNAYRDVMTAAGLVPHVWNYQSEIPNEERRESVREELRDKRGQEFLNYYLQSRPTAVVCYSDMDAMLVRQVLDFNKIRIPEDVSIVGYDDLPNVCMFNPPLTTVRSDFYRMGWVAAEMLLKLARQESDTIASVIVQPELVIRKSTCPPAS